jgi:SulP family sulfate permease
VQGDALIRWLPGLILAAALLVVSRRCDNCLIMPGLLLAAFVVFYGALWLTNTSIPAATAQGWLIDMLPKGGGRLWPPMGPADVQLVNWSVLGRQMGGLAAVAIINVVSILLNITGIELAAGQDIDLNHELKAAGFSNLVAGLGGGGVGCHVLGDSILAHRIGARSRLVGVFLAAVCGAVLLVGGSLLSYFPSPVLGGLLLFLGLDFLVEWIYEAWFRLPKIDCLVVILIMLAIYQVGVLEGVGLGVALAVVVFIVDYSRVDVIRHALSGITCRSNIERPRLYRQLLSQKGDWLYILELQGFIFFGTANKLLDRVRRRMDDPDLPAPRFIVLDFRLVSGLDSSAVLSFARMKQLAQRQGVTLILTHLAPQMRRQLGGEVLDEPKDERDGAVLTFPDLDHGVEWCEEQMIRTFEDVGLAAKAKTLRQQLEEFLPVSSRATNLLAQLEEARSTSSIIARVWARLDEEDRTQLERAQPLSAGDIDLMDYLERGEVGTGHYLIRQGDEPKALYFIETGQVTIQLESRDERHRVVRLRTMGAGTIVGEIGLYLGRLTTASVVTDQPTTFYRLSADNLARMEETAPEIAAAFHKFIVCLLGERLADANAALEALVD